jgi:hypothetical protein
MWREGGKLLCKSKDGGNFFSTWSKTTDSGQNGNTILRGVGEDDALLKYFERHQPDSGKITCASNPLSDHRKHIHQ